MQRRVGVQRCNLRTDGVRESSWRFSDCLIISDYIPAVATVIVTGNIDMTHKGSPLLPVASLFLWSLTFVERARRYRRAP